MNGVIAQKWDQNGVAGTESEINDVVALLSDDCDLDIMTRMILDRIRGI